MKQTNYQCSSPVVYSIVNLVELNMPCKDVFQTIEGNSKGLFKDKGSSFISYIFPVFDESVVKEHLLVLKKEHPKARHICYAYRWGPDPDYNRINDDGEPNGTAGKPILNQLRSHELENTLVAVVRYFGGMSITLARNSCGKALEVVCSKQPCG